MKRRDTIVRYTAPERINHWITAFCFILAAVSGLGFLFPSFNWLMQIMGTPQLARILHPFVGVVMFASFIIMFFRYWHHNLINRDDIFWAKNIRKIVVNEEVGDTGRYNFGQKCVFWAAIIFLVLLLVSGVIIWRPYFAPAFSIPVNRHNHLAKVFGLRLFLIAELELIKFRHPLYQLGDAFTKKLFHVLVGGGSIFNHVMQLPSSAGGERIYQTQECIRYYFFSFPCFSSFG